MLLFRASRGPISLPFPSRWTRPIQRSRMSSAGAPFLFFSSHRTQMCMEAIMRFAWMMFAALLLQACSTPELSKQAAAVEVVTQMAGNTAAQLLHQLLPESRISVLEI
jgi:hypothetical protein